MNEDIDEWRLIEGSDNTAQDARDVCRAVELEQWENRRLTSAYRAICEEDYQATTNRVLKVLQGGLEQSTSEKKELGRAEPAK